MSIFSAPLATTNYLTSYIRARLLLISQNAKVLGAKIENDFRGDYDYDIQVLPPIEIEYFAYWRSYMEYFIMFDINNWFRLDDGFEAPKDREGRIFKKKK